MSKAASKLGHLLAELKRRKVYRVAAVYVVVGLVVVEAANNFLPALNVPDWTITLVVVLTILGLPIALVLAWALELTPEGIRVTPPAEKAEGAAAGEEEATAAGDQAPIGRPTTEPHEPAPRRGPSDDRPCVVVLPFANLSGDPENEFFSDGVTEDIMARLAGIRGLRVISRTTAMRYKGTDLSVPQIAAELGAQAAVEGTVRRSAERVRVTAQLIDAERDEHLWAETYDRVLEDVFAVQSDVAENIARALDTELTPGERERLQRKPTENLAAYDLCLKGMRTTGSLDPEALRRSERYFQEAIALDPGYARAYAGLAMTLVFKGYIADVAPAELFPQLRAMANEALRLDPGLGEAYTALACLAFWYEWDWARVERELQRALEINPDDMFALLFRGFSLLVAERFAEAETFFREALRRDPHHAMGNVDLAQLRRCTGRPDEGVTILDGVLRREPRNYDARLWRGICQIDSGNLEQAASDFDLAISMVGRLPVTIMFRGLVHAFSGEKEPAQRILEELRARAKDEYVDPYYLFSLCLPIEGFDAAFTYLERMLEVRSRFVTYLRVTPRYRELRSDPRFMRVLRKVWPDDF